MTIFQMCTISVLSLWNENSENGHTSPYKFHTKYEWKQFLKILYMCDKDDVRVRSGGGQRRDGDRAVPCWYYVVRKFPLTPFDYSCHYKTKQYFTVQTKNQHGTIRPCMVKIRRNIFWVDVVFTHENFSP